MKKNQNVFSVLKETRRLIKNGWCRCTPAKDRWGRACDATSPKASKFCITGAVRHVVGETMFDTPGQKLYEQVIAKIAKHCPAIGWRNSSVPSVEVQCFNDSATSKRHVVAMLDDVISSLKLKGHR